MAHFGQRGRACTTVATGLDNTHLMRLAGSFVRRRGRGLADAVFRGLGGWDGSLPVGSGVFQPRRQRQPPAPMLRVTSV